MSRPAKIGAIVVATVLVVGVVLAQLPQSGSSGDRAAGPSPEDAGPDGLLGLSLLLDGTDHPVERVARAPSDGELDPEKTSILVQPGALTAADANALNDVATDGGRVVVAGDPGAVALERLLGTEAEVDSGSGPGPFAPLVPAPETNGIAFVEADGGDAVVPAGAALPLLANGAEPILATSAVGDGEVIVLADPSPLSNRLLASADNARLALNLAGPGGRGVQLVEVVRTPPGSGLAALPPEWGWAAGGLTIAVLALAFARGRRLGPPELPARPLQPPRRVYLDALASALVKTRDPRSAAVPLREAARDRVARRAGLAPDADEPAFRRAAEAAGLEPAEVDVVCAAGGGDAAMLAAAGALAKLNKTT